MKSSALIRCSLLFLAALVTIPFQARAQAPSNDNFASALVYSGTSMTISASTINATAEPGEPDSFLGNASFTALRSVWWKYTPTVSGFYQIDCIGSGYDTAMSVFSGSALNNLTRLAQDDDSGGSGTSMVRLYLTKGTSYRIVVDSYAGTSGVAKLQVKMVRYVPALTWQGVSNFFAVPFDISNTGLISLTTTNAGLVTGKITLGGVAHSFTSALDMDGSLAISVPRANRPPFNLIITTTAVTLNLPDGVSATCVNGMGFTLNGHGIFTGGSLSPAGAGDAAMKTIVPAVAPWSSTNPCPRAGRYNFIIQGSIAFGASPASVTISPTGTCTAAGTMGDGTAFTFAGPLLNSNGCLTALGDNGACCFSIPLYNKTGILNGTLAFNASVSPAIITGQVIWIRQPGKTPSAFLAEGITSYISVYGSRYTAPAANTRIDPVFNPAGFCTFRTTPVGFPAISQVMTLSLANQLTSTAPNSNQINLSVAASTGLLTGSAKYTGATAKSTVKAVFIKNPLLPKIGFYGYMSGPSFYSSVTIDP